MVDDVMDKRGTVEQHPLVGMVMVGFRDFLSAIRIPLPNLRVDHSFNLNGGWGWREGGG